MLRSLPAKARRVKDAWAAVLRESAPTRQALKIALPVLLLVLGAWVLWGVAGFLIHLTSEDAGMARMGEIGDHFGSLNALFTGVGFAALIATIWLQIHELEEGRKANARQAREGFLAARINATLAVLEAAGRDERFLTVYLNDESKAVLKQSSEHVAALEKSRLIQHIKILECESNMVPETGWNRDVQATSVCQYILNEFRLHREALGQIKIQTRDEVGMPIAERKPAVEAMVAHTVMTMQSMAMTLADQPFSESMDAFRMVSCFSDALSYVYDEMNNKGDVYQYLDKSIECMASACGNLTACVESMKDLPSNRPWNMPLRSIFTSSSPNGMAGL